MSNGLLDSALRELEALFRPLSLAATEPEYLIDLLRRLGWTIDDLLPALAQIAGGLGGVNDAIDEIRTIADGGQVDLAQLGKAFGRTAGIPRAVKSLEAEIVATLPAIAADLAGLAGEILELLLTDWLARRAPLTFAVLAAVGVIVQERSTQKLGTGGRVLRRVVLLERIRLDALAAWVSTPAAQASKLFGFASMQDDASARAYAARLFPLLAALGAAIGAVPRLGRAGPIRRLSDDEELAIAYMLSLQWTASVDGLAEMLLGLNLSTVSAPEGGPGLMLMPYGDASLSVARGGWSGVAELGGNVPWILLKSTSVSMGGGAGDWQGSLAVGRPGTTLRLGGASGTRLEISDPKASASIKFGSTLRDIAIGLATDRVRLVVASGDGDGFLAKVLPNPGVDLEFDLDIEWKLSTGLRFKGSAALDFTLPLHKDIGGVLLLESLTLHAAALADKPAAPLEASVSLSAKLQLGPLTATVQHIGMAASMSAAADGGSLGPLHAALAFKPPDGIGLVLDTAAIRGGGGLQIQPDMYSGALQLCINQVIDLTAIGLVNTKLPGGAAGFALLVLITAKFQPIQLGYGFTLNGVGGLAALNHSMNQQALSDGVRNHTLDSILFPTNPVANANKIISDLQRVFPVTPGRFVFAPMVELGWGGSVLLIDVALVVDLPSPLRLTILGRMHLLLPPATDGAKDDAAKVVVINLDVQGSLDLDQDAISVDAQLYDSRLALFPITGGMAMRIRWGAQPVFLFALGGFNPRFTPPPGFPALDRVGIQMRYDKDGVRAGLCLTSYFAVTTNTLQFGARIDAYAEVSIAKLAGYLGFDALVDMVPFHVILDLYGGVSVEAFGLKFSCDLLLTLAAFDPVTGDGHVTIDFLGKHEAPIHFSIGDAKPLPAMPVADALHELMNALADAANWSAGVQAGAGMVVNLRPPTAAEVTASAGKPMAHPLARLSVRQRVLPFKVALQRFGAATPAQPGPFDIATLTLGSAAAAAPAATAALRDDFARGQFIVLSDDDKLCAPQFESFVCGYDGLGTEGARVATAQVAEFSYDTRVIDDRAQPPKALPDVVVSYDYTRRMGQVGALPAAAAARYAAPPKGIKVGAPQWKSVATDHIDAAAPDTFDTYTQAQAHRRAQPGAGKQQVVESFELA